MSEHELWNELGNLYFLSDSYDQAIHAYEKAIQLNSEYGKSYSNLALIYAKQARYEDAIRLYKKSLDLLNSDEEKAATWNRLGNVYKSLKEYQEAVFAYQCADDLRATPDEKNRRSNQMLYVSSESEYLSYELAKEQQGFQNHSADYMQDIEPEFDEALPELVLVEAEMLANETHFDQNPLRDWTVGSIAGPDEHAVLVNEPEISTPEEPEVITLDEPVERISPEESLTDEVVQTGDDDATVDSQKEEVAELELDEITPLIWESGIGPEEDAPGADDLDAESPQSEENFEALPDALTSALMEEAVFPDVEALPVGYEPIPSVSAEDETEAPVVDVISTNPDASSGSEEEVVQGPESESIEPIAQAVDETDETEEHHLDLAPSAAILEPAQQAVDENAQEAKRDLSAEERKLSRQIEINPRSATTWEALGTLYKTAGRYEEAIQAFKQAIAIAPDTVSYHHNLGLVYAAQGKNEEAFTTFQNVLELNPDHSLTHASLGGYYKKMGLDELAQKHIGKAMKQIYESENEYNRACMDAICGNTDQAIDLLRVALENKQTYVDWVIHDPDLDVLRDDDRFKQLVSEYNK